MSEPLAAVDELYLEGLELKRQQLRRQHPDLDDHGIERLVRAWIDDRPPDAPGRIVRR